MYKCENKLVFFRKINYFCFLHLLFMDKKETSNGKRGGLLKGKPHYDKDGNSLGGIKAVVTDAGGKPVELEGGEVIINKEASKKHWKALSKLE